MTTQAYSLAVLAAPILSRCWLFMVIVNSFSLATDEGFHSPRAGGCSSACGWSCYSKIRGKSYINPSITLQFCFSTQMFTLDTSFNIVISSLFIGVSSTFCVDRARLEQLLAYGKPWTLHGSSTLSTPLWDIYGLFAVACKTLAVFGLPGYLVRCFFNGC